MARFAEELHIRPWEMDLLTLRQFETLVKYLEAKDQRQQ